MTLLMNDSNNRSTSLSELIQMLSAVGISLSTLFHRILEVCIHHTSATYGHIMQVDFTGDYLQTIAVLGDGPVVYPCLSRNGPGVVCRVARDEAMLHIADINHLDWKDVYVATNPETKAEIAALIRDPSTRELLGILNLEKPTKGYFPDEDVALIMTVVEIASLAIRQMNVQLALERERDIRSLLRMIDLNIINGKEPSITIQSALENILALLEEYYPHLEGTLAANVMLYDSLYEDLRMVAHIGVAEEHIDRRQKLNEGIVGKAFTHQRSVYINDTQLSQDYMGFIEDRLSEYVTLLVSNGQKLGGLNIESSIRDAFPLYVRDVIDMIAGQMAIALASGQSARESQQELRRSEALSHAASQLSQARDRDGLFQIVTNALVRYGRVRASHIWEWINRGFALRAEYAPHEEDKALDFIGLEGSNQYLFGAPESLLYVPGRAKRHLMLSPWEEDAVIVIGVQITLPYSGKYIGNLIALFDDDEDPFNQQLLLEGLATQLGSALERLEAYERVKTVDVATTMAPSLFILVHKMQDLGLVQDSLRHALDTIMAGDRSQRPAAVRDLQEAIDALSLPAEYMNRLRKRVGQWIDDPDSNTSTASPALIIEHAIEKARGVQADHVTLTLDIDPLLPNILVDEDAPVVFTDLLNNAVEALEGLLGMITVTARQVDQMVEIIVTDTGKGIPVENQDDIFKFGFTSKPKNTNHFGFGLWTSYVSIARLHGNLELTWSEVGVGSSFSVWLPIAKGAPNG